MSQVKVFALGGLDESGKNMYVVEVNDSIIVIEAGLKYPDADQLGVEIIIPDFTYLIENKDRVKGIIITHGHDDVMAALPFLLKQINIPVYTTPLTAELISNMIHKEGIRNVKIHRIKRSGEFKIDGIKVRTFSMTHSIADAFGVAIDTPQGYVVYTGEFLIDYDIRDEAFQCNISDLAEIGKKGVLCLLTESGSADRKGHTSPNHRIKELIQTPMEDAPGRIIITVYHQNFYRIMEIVELANKLNKKIFIYDEGLKELIRFNERLGYYRIPMGLELPSSSFSNDLDDIIILITGNGHKVFRTMNRIAMKEDSKVELRENDTIIIASPIVPGTEIEAGIMENELYKEDVNIIALNSKSVLSMHASSEDLKMMMYLFKPKYYIPVKGEYRQLVSNANIAMVMGLTADKIIVLDNGQMAVFEDKVLKSCSRFIDLEEVLIDGDDNLDVTGYVLRDRETLSTDGVIVIGIVCNYKTKEIIGGPDVQSRGVFYLKDADYIVKNIADMMMNIINENVANNTYDNMSTRMEAREKIQKYVLKETGKRPMILPAIIEINVQEE
ncbi:MAG: ribonuclease J [Erysipelotrichaceae bacterium]|nr:ribonuclease J [Erysipelotrichaceae bacterium]